MSDDIPYDVNSELVERAVGDTCRRCARGEDGGCDWCASFQTRFDDLVEEWKSGNR